MKKVKLVVMVLAVMIAAGCSHAWRTNQEIYPEKDPTEVKIFFTGSPQVPYEEIARVNISKFRPFPPGIPMSSGNMLWTLKRKVAKLGGDALINITEDFASISGVVVIFKSQISGKRQTSQ